MAEITLFITCLCWLALAVMVFVRVKQWNKAFAELYEELKSQFEVSDNG